MLRQHARTLVQPDSEVTIKEALMHIANRGSLDEVDPEKLWHLYDWLDSAIDSAYHLFPHVQTALRKKKFMPAD